MEILATLRSTRLPPSFIFFKKKKWKSKAGSDWNDPMPCRIRFTFPAITVELNQLFKISAQVPPVGLAAVGL